MKVTTAIYLDKRRAKNDNTFPVKLRVTYNRKSRLYSTDFSFSTDDFDKIMTERPRGEFKDYRMEFGVIEKKAMSIVEKLPVFSFDGFEKRYLNVNYDSTNLYTYFDQKISELINLESYRTSEIYSNSKRSIESYHNKKKLTIHEVTPKFLKEYELWMLANDKSVTTISMYLRCLRHIINLFGEENEFDPKLYPFRRNKYVIPQPKSVKKALSMEEIKLLYEYKAEPGSAEEYYRDLWIFSYLCNGINMNDICLLKNRDIQGNHIYFRREKTRNTNRSSMPIGVPLIDKIKVILERWSKNSLLPNDFVFPILNKQMSKKEIIGWVKQETKQTNKYIDRIARDVGIKDKVTTYTARHSYATTLKRLGVSVAFIGEQLGHKNSSTTENYLDSFEDETKRDIANKLLDF